MVISMLFVNQLLLECVVPTHDPGQVALSITHLLTVCFAWAIYTEAVECPEPAAGAFGAGGGAAARQL